MYKRRKIFNESGNWHCHLLFAAFFLLSYAAKATTYYSRSSANWNVSSTWSTAGYGGSSASAFPVSGDTVKIGNTYTVTINTSSACTQIDIGEGSSGTLQYSGGGAYTLTVTGNISVNQGASFIYNSNNSRTHSLLLGGNFINNGTVDLYYDANDIVSITFNTSTNTYVSGSGSWALNNVTINKSSSSVITEVQVSGFESAINTLAGTTGTYIHNNSGSYSVNSGSSSDFNINQNMVFKIPQGTMWFSSNANRTNLYGSLYITGGQVFIGSTAGNNGLRYDKNGTNIPYLEISSGSLTSYGGISYATGAGSDPFSFRMTGGTILLNSGSTGTIVEPFLINDVSTSEFYMTGGTITMQSPNNSGSSIVDWGICGNNGTVTTLGGTVYFGNSTTGNNKTFSFIPYAGVTQPNFEIAGPAGNTITLAPSNGTSSDYKLLSLKINTGKIFDNRSYGGTNNDSKTMTITATYNGVCGFYNSGSLSARTGTVVMGSTEAQTIGGTSNTVFYNLTISNPGGVTIDHAESVSNLLTMSSGLLHTTASKIITCTSTADATMGCINSFVDGPMIHTIASGYPATRNFPAGKDDDYRPAILNVTHTNSTQVTYNCEMINASANDLNYALPYTINKVSFTRYWNIERENVSNLSGASMTLYYDLDDTVTDRNRVIVAHDDGNERWADYGGSGSANNTGFITSGTITTFKTKFALGFPPATLPVDLVSFLAKKSGEKVFCDWITASESNSDYFTVERSADGITYDSLSSLIAHGNTTKYNFYHYEDEKPLHGHSYYRLRQTDFNGKSIHASPMHVYFDLSPEKYTFFPNPSPGKIHITKPGDSMNGTSAVVQDRNGKQVQADHHFSIDGNEMTIDIDPDVTGTNDFFILSIITSDGITQEKVLVEKKY